MAFSIVSIVGGFDEQMAQHFAHLFIRDPISLFSERLNCDDEKDTDHFENIQSTNWQVDMSDHRIRH